MEPHIVVNDDKSIKVPNELKNIAVQYDHNIRSVIFDCPRFWNGTDLSDMDMKIQFKRSDGHNGEYKCIDIKVNNDDENLIHFSWLISNEVTSIPGRIEFILCASKNYDDGTKPKVWHSQVCNVMKILRGMECKADIKSDYEVGHEAGINDGRIKAYKEATDNGIKFDYLFYSSLQSEVPLSAEDFSKVKHESSNRITTWYMFGNNSNIKSVTGYDMSNVWYARYMFYQCSNLEHVSLLNTKDITSFDSMFYSCVRLITVDKMDLSGGNTTSSFNGMFTLASKLVNISFEEGSIKQPISFKNSSSLSQESINSIIDGLNQRSAVSSTYKLTLPTALLSKLTKEQTQRISDKNWIVG